MVTLRVQSLSKSSNWSLSRSQAIRGGQSSSRAPRLRTTVMPVTLRRGCDRFPGGRRRCRKDAAIRIAPADRVAAATARREPHADRQGCSGIGNPRSQTEPWWPGGPLPGGTEEAAITVAMTPRGLEALSSVGSPPRSGRSLPVGPSPAVPAVPRIATIVLTVRVSGGRRHRPGDRPLPPRGPPTSRTPRAGGGRHPARRLPVRPAVHHG